MNTEPKMIQTVREFIAKDGIFYHAQLAPGVKFNEANAEKVSAAIERNMERMMSPAGSRYDIPLRDIF